MRVANIQALFLNSKEEHRVEMKLPAKEYKYFTYTATGVKQDQRIFIYFNIEREII